MGEAKVTVGGAVGYALSLFGAHWRAIWGVLALNALAATIVSAGQLADDGRLVAGGGVVTIVFALMLQGALYRLAFADRHLNDPEFRPGQLGLQWRGAEWRLLAAAGLAALGMLFIALLFGLAASAVIYSILEVQGADLATVLRVPDNPAQIDPGRDWPLLVLQLSLALPLLFMALRLALVAPATVDAKALRVFRTWGRTRGQALRILVAALVVQLPFLFLQSLVGAALPDGAGLSSGAIMAAALCLGLPLGFVLAPLSAGVAAYFHRNLPPAPEGAKKVGSA
jgi:hypothetical protein